MPAPRATADQIRVAIHIDEGVQLLTVSDEFDTWAIGSTAVLKLARADDHGKKLAAESRVQPLLHQALDGLVPAVLDRGEIAGAAWTLYERATGRQGQTIDGTTVRAAAGLAEDVGRTLAGLHATPVEAALALGVAGRDVALADVRVFHASTLDTCAAIAGRDSISAFLAGERPSPIERTALCHADVKGEHVFVDEAARRLTSVIDWADCAVCDPAQDYAGLVIWLGPDFTRAAVAASGEDDGSLAERALWLGRFGLLDYWEAVIDGRESGPVPLITEQLRIAFGN
jgi:aminoglycoside phosphotransferase (APT) family kinase protein